MGEERERVRKRETEGKRKEERENTRKKVVERRGGKERGRARRKRRKTCEKQKVTSLHLSTPHFGSSSAEETRLYLFPGKPFQCGTVGLEQASELIQQSFTLSRQLPCLKSLVYGSPIDCLKDQ